MTDPVSRPSLLQIVAGLWPSEGLSQKVDQLTSAFIMDLFVSQNYRREGLRDKAFPGIMALTTSEREYFMRGIASFMASHDLPNQITGKQLNQTIKELLVGPIVVLFFALLAFDYFAPLMGATGILWRMITPLVFAVVGGYFAINILSAHALRDRLALWLSLCHGMGIDPKDVHRASGIWWVPKVNEISPYGYIKAKRPHKISSGSITG